MILLKEAFAPILKGATCAVLTRMTSGGPCLRPRGSPWGRGRASGTWRWAFAVGWLGLSLPASAQSTPPDLIGLWGSEAQCAQAPLLDGGSVLAEPFDIREGWLRHGAVWCRLAWFPAQPRDGGLFASARAQCGEDSVRSYGIGFLLDGDSLTLIWDERLRNGPLSRCPKGEG